MSVGDPSQIWQQTTSQLEISKPDISKMKMDPQVVKQGEEPGVPQLQEAKVLDPAEPEEEVVQHDCRVSKHHLLEVGSEKQENCSPPDTGEFDLQHYARVSIW